LTEKVPGRGCSCDPGHNRWISGLRLHFGFSLAARAGLTHLKPLSETETVPAFVIAQLRDRWQARIKRIEEVVREKLSGSSTAEVYRQLRRDLLAVEGAELNRLYEASDITNAIRRRSQRMLDLEHAGLGDDDH
jgi:CPA1 family monovalent cation:H+ antiporter